MTNSQSTEQDGIVAGNIFAMLDSANSSSPSVPVPAQHAQPPTCAGRIHQMEQFILHDAKAS